MFDRPPGGVLPSSTSATTSRLLRGYGPFVMLASLVLGMAVFVPSRVPESTTMVAGAPPSAMSTGPEGAPAGGAVKSLPGGEAGGGGDPAAPTLTPSGEPATPDDASAIPAAGGVVPCPDREEQIPGDPYSPPCLSFSGDNGGATWQGVTDDEIRISFRRTQDAGAEQALAEIMGADQVDTPDDIYRTFLAVVDYINEQFQLYGRRIVVVGYDGQGSLANELQGMGRDRAEVDATTVAEDIGAFADLTSFSEPYSDALARRGVMSFGAPLLSREWFSERRPYAWSLLPDCSTVVEIAAEYVLKRLAGGDADFAGGDLTGQPRRITAIAPENSWYQECLASAEQLLRDAGYEFEVRPLTYRLDLSTMSSQAASMVPRLRADGVTTILCGCDPIFPAFLSGVANRDRYYPEFVSGYEQDIFGQLWHPNFTRHAFGVSPLGPGASLPPHATIGYAAYKTVRDDEPAVGIDGLYYSLYMFALGLQLAGPELTPETFEQGMFSYPERLGPAGLWRFGPGDYTPMKDYHEMYWDPDGISAYNGRRGTWVDPNPGVRYRHGADEMPPGPPNIPQRG